jgi:hypothetical protein
MNQPSLGGNPSVFSIRRYMTLMGHLKLTKVECITLSALFLGMLLLLGQSILPKSSSPDHSSKEIPGQNRIESLLGLDELA